MPHTAKIWSKMASGCPCSNVVICTTGSTNRMDPFGPYKVDFEGTSNLVAAAKRAGVKKFVLVSLCLRDCVFGGLKLN